MKRVLSLIALIIIMMVLLTGCVKVDYNVKIKKDGSGEFSYIYGFDKTFLEQMQISAEDMIAEMEQNAEMNNYQIESYSDDSIQGFKAIKEVPDITKDFSLEEAFGEDYVKDTDENRVNVKKGFFGKRFSQKASIDLSSMENMSSYGVVLKYTVDLPIKAGKNNATTVSNNGKTLTWELKAGEITDIEFETLNLDVIIIGMVAGGIILITLTTIIILFLRKNKNKKQDIDEGLEKAMIDNLSEENKTDNIQAENED